MTKETFLSAQAWAQLEAGPLGPYLDLLAESLRAAGYPPSSITRCLKAAAKFGRWLNEQHLSVAEVTAAVVERYIAGLGRRPCPTRSTGCLPEAACGLKQLFALLTEQGVIQPSVPQRTPGPLDELLRAFGDYLDQVIGVSAGTRHIYLRYARLFLESLGAAAPDLALVTAEAICEFVRGQAAKLKPSSCRLPVSSIRAFLRFLATHQLIRPGLEGAVPTLRQWKLAALPKHLSADELARVLEACDTQTAVGLRDRALLLLLARLGLRAAEALQLSLDDIDWQEGSLLIRAGKSQRERLLPLSDEVGSALVAYLKKGRPKSHLSTIFLRACPPIRSLKSSSAVTTIVKSAMRRADVPTLGRAAHALRHTAATSLVAHGSSFKEVADILGHQHLVTTTIYAKLDLGKLADVALPWPGGEQ